MTNLSGSCSNFIFKFQWVICKVDLCYFCGEHWINIQASHGLFIFVRNCCCMHNQISMSPANRKHIVRALRGGIGLAFYGTKVWSHHLNRIPAVIKETSFLKSTSRSNSQSRCWKIAKYWCCSTKFGTVFNHVEWVH